MERNVIFIHFNFIVKSALNQMIWLWSVECTQRQKWKNENCKCENEWIGVANGWYAYNFYTIETNADFSSLLNVNASWLCRTSYPK